MPAPPPAILRVAVPSPLRRCFDYLPPPDCAPAAIQPGARVRVPFGRQNKVGIVVEVSHGPTVPAARLRAAQELIDHQSEVPRDILELSQWASGYYHHPIGDALATSLPVLLRQGQPATLQGTQVWQLTEAGRTVDPLSLSRAPRQAALLQRLAEQPAGLGGEALCAVGGDWRGALRNLAAKGWVAAHEQWGGAPPAPAAEPPPTLNPAQQRAVESVTAALGGFRTFLVHGVTGSGKTEVYLRIIERALAQGRQALLLVPEIGLTPQLVERFTQRFPVTLAVLHSGLSDRERLNAWLAARDGTAPVIIGTRSAVFTPLRHPGVIIVDEEHDLSYKQQDGLRYCARDLAVIRGQRCEVPVVLASATPSLESLHNVEQGRYELLQLPERAGVALHPRMELLDVRAQPMDDGLSAALLAHMRRHLDRDGQVLLFLNRRGYAPTLLCHDCGWLAECERCDAHMTLHKGRGRLICHHCGAQRPVQHTCPACGSADLRTVGQGTERMETALHEQFPDVGIVRIDRDSTRNKGAMQARLDRVHSGAARILVGTQMIAKGHHFPRVTLVGIIDSDQGLFSADFRAGERMAQMVLQVAGRAGRAEQPGEVLIQTHYPDHPLLQLLVRQDYDQFARAALAERREAGLPPYTVMALLRAEAPEREAPALFLEDAATRASALGCDDVELFGPLPAPMERRQGRFRAQLLLQAPRRASLHNLLNAWVPQLEQLKTARKVRWSLDVDPLDMM